MSLNRLPLGLALKAITLFLFYPVSVVTQCENVRGYTPVSTQPGFIKHVTSQPGSSWSEMDQLCQKQYPGYDLLQQHYTKLKPEDVKLCGDVVVPLGLKQVGDKLMWKNGRGIDMEDVLEADILRMSHTNPEDTKTIQETLGGNRTMQVGALNLTINKWNLVQDDFKFNCALCQLLRRADIKASVHPVRPGYRYLTILIGPKISNGTVDNMQNVLDGLAIEFKTTTANVTYLLFEVDRHNKTLYHFLVSTLNEDIEGDKLVENQTVIAMNYSLTKALLGADYCLRDNYWWEADINTVKTERVGSYRTSYIESSQECAYEYSPHGFQAVQMDVQYWENDWTRCKIESRQHKIEAVLRMLQSYARQPVRRAKLEDVVKTVNRINGLDIFHHEVNLTDRLNILTAVDRILINTILEPDHDFYNTNTSKIDLIVANLQVSNPLIGFAIDIKRNDEKEKDDEEDDEEDDEDEDDDDEEDDEEVDKMGLILKSTFLKRSSDRMLTPTSADIDVVLSPTLISTHSRLAVTVYANFDIFKKIDILSEYWAHEVALQIILNSENKTQLASRNGSDFFVDIYVNKVEDDHNWVVFSIDDVDWTRTPCSAIGFKNCSATVFRCWNFNQYSETSLGGKFIVHNIQTVKVSTKVMLINNCAKKGSIKESEVENIADIIEDINNNFYVYNSNEYPYITLSDTLENLGKVLLNVDFDKINDLVISNRSDFKFLSSSFRNTNPTVGFTYQGTYSKSTLKPIRQSEKNSINGSIIFGLVVSDVLASTNTRMSASVFNRLQSLFPRGNSTTHFSIFNGEGILLTFKVDAQTRHREISNDENIFYDVYVDADSDDEGYKRRIVVWDMDSNGWSSCSKLRSTRDSKDVFRCKKLTKGPDYLQTKLLIYNSRFDFQDFLDNNENLTVFMVVEGFLSLLALLSIIATATLRKWRQELSNKILLHMTSALSLNLIFGFLNHFLQLDTKRISCIVLGVLRHYSYLSMFAWMLVLATLQLVRLLTIAGAKTTHFLLLKVSAFAWGVPLIAPIVLLSWDINFYRSVEQYRGYCYPEGLTFTVSVQGPAGFVLLLNTIFFIVILARLYACCGWGTMESLQRHGLRNATHHWRNLRNSFFIFVLFGFAWLFHLLTEWGIIKNKFLYEYLSLITAKTHVCMLALFFVLLDAKTRGFWRERFGKWSWMHGWGCREITSCTGDAVSGIRQEMKQRVSNMVGDVTGIEMSTFQPKPTDD